MIEQRKARKLLLDKAGLTDTGKPLALIAHNGQGFHELEPSLDSLDLSEYQMVKVTQDQKAIGSIHLTDPIARYFAGVDRLIAASSPNLFWEWQRYGRLNASVTWLDAKRINDDPVKRAKVKLDKLELRQAPNGAEKVMELVCDKL